MTRTADRDSQSMDCAASDQDDSRILILQDMAAHATLLSETPLTGQIAGTTYMAAATSRDGACGLHSLFGQSLRGELSASNA